MQTIVSSITRMADEKVTTTQPTDIIPEVDMVLRGKRMRRSVGANSALLCVAAGLDDWQFLRESVADTGGTLLDINPTRI